MLIESFMFLAFQVEPDPERPLAADKPSPVTLEPLPLDQIQVTAGRQARTRFEAAEAVTVVSAQEIERRPVNVVPEFLRGEPGVFFQQTTPGQGTPIVRGLKGSQVLNLVNGMRLNNAFFRSAPNQYLALVDARNVKQIELLRGPASTLYGSDAMGGVVQILTPEPALSGGGSYTEGAVSAAIASGDLSTILHADATLAGETVGLRAGATYSSYGDRRTGSGDRIVPSAYRARAANFSLLTEPAAGHELLLDVQLYEQPSTPRVDELVPGFGQTEPDSDEFFFEPNTRDFFHARYRIERPFAGVDRITLNLARQIIEDDRRTRGNGSIERNLEQNTSTLDGFTAQLDSFVSNNVTLTYGLEYYTDEVESARQRINLGDGSSTIVRSRFPDGSTMDSLALYGHAEWQVQEDWRVSGGLRYSRFDIDLASGPDSPGAQLDPDDVTGNVSVTWYATDQVHWVANLGRGFRAPNIFDLGTLGPRPGNRFNVANPNLDPETVNSIDLGMKWRGYQIQGEVFAFYSDYQDRITSVPTGEFTDDGRQIVRSENVGEVTLYGIEAGGRYYFSDALEFFAVLNYVRGTETNDGVEQPADRVPPFNGRLGLQYRTLNDLEIEPYLLFAKRQDRLSDRDIGDPRINPEGTPGWGTFNLRVRYPFTNTFDAQLDFENIFDRRYREHGSGIDAPGFNAQLSLNWRF